LSDSSRAQNVRSANDQFVVFQDFSDIVISERQTRAVRAFIDGGPLTSGSVTASNPTLQTIASRSLESRVELVAKKEDTNLLVQLRMYQTMNYAIRNPKRKPSHGLIMVSVCKHPIVTIGTDCENLTYYYFADYDAADIFQTVFAMWLNAVFPRQAQ
jgi:hypothetical protein